MPDTGLTREGLLGLEAPKPRKVELPGGKHCFVRMMTGAERGILEKDQGKINFWTWAVVKCACDENGKRLFKDDDESKVGQLSSDVLVPIWTAAAEFNNLTSESKADLVGNSNGSQSGDFGSN